MADPTLRIRCEWLDGTSGVETHARTWARLEIAIGNIVATRVDAGGSIRDAVYVPVMPLAEWLTANWWFIESEGPIAYPIRALRDESDPAALAWHRRHNLLFAREGSPLPDLAFARAHRDLMAVVLGRDPPSEESYPVRFVEQCSMLIDARQALDEFSRLLDSVVERLIDCAAPDAIEFRSRWNAIRSCTGDDRAMREHAATLGLDGDDPDVVDDSLAQALVLAALPDELAVDLLEVVRPDEVGACAQIVGAARGHLPPAPAASAFGDLQSAVRAGANGAPDVAPHRHGWRLARAFRDAVGLSHDSVAQAADDEIESRVPLDVAQGSFGSASIRGLVRSETGGVAALITAAAEPTRRFLRARALGLALDGGRERLVTNARSRSQAASRAFATELLAPIAWIRTRVGGGSISWQRIEEIAAELHAPPQAVLHQIENHRVAVVE